jgi:uncharacterized membrane protein YeaQ/YmgE (transglycosylase-associated protein family)
MVLDILLGIVGSVVGGWLSNVLGYSGISRFDVHGLIVATLGAIAFLFLYHAIRRNVVGRRYF